MRAAAREFAAGLGIAFSFGMGVAAVLVCAFMLAGCGPNYKINTVETPAVAPAPPPAATPPSAAASTIVMGGGTTVALPDRPWKPGDPVCGGGPACAYMVAHPDLAKSEYWSASSVARGPAPDRP